MIFLLFPEHLSACHGHPGHDPSTSKLQIRTHLWWVLLDFPVTTRMDESHSDNVMPKHSKVFSQISGFVYQWVISCAIIQTWWIINSLNQALFHPAREKPTMNRNKPRDPSLTGWLQKPTTRNRAQGESRETAVLTHRSALLAKIGFQSNQQYRKKKFAWYAILTIVDQPYTNCLNWLVDKLHY